MFEEITVSVNTIVQKFGGRWKGSRTDTLNVGFSDLLEKIGQPSTVDSSDDKVDVEWNLLVGDEAIVSIWNYKDGPGYGKLLEDIKSFSIGGPTLAVLIVKAWLEPKPDHIFYKSD